MGITKPIVSAAIDEANIEHIEGWREGLSFSASVNQIISEHRHLAAFGIVTRELTQYQVLCPKGSKAEVEEQEMVGPLKCEPTKRAKGIA